MNEQQTKQAIINALGDFGKHPLADAATALLGALGYKSQRHIPLSPNTPENFLSQFDQAGRIKPEQAQIQEWESVDFLFQLTGEEIQPSAKTLSLFEGDKRVNNQLIQSYLFFALRLKKPSYSRSELAAITRALNRLFPMPALILFVHGQTLTLSIINRRLHKRDEAKDVLEKVTLIKDIQSAKPHRAHIEILYDLSIEALQQKYPLTSFVDLHNAWQKTLDSSELNKSFYQKVANWYFWACNEVKFPRDAGKDKKTRNAVSLIRLITRLIFVWFVKEKGLIPEDLFDQRKVTELLKGFGEKDTVYYKAILQNLFFATLNTEMNTTEKPDSRRFRTRTNQPRGRDQHYMVHNLYRYRDCFKEPDQALKLFATIPFLNGGLFECLDAFDEKDPEKVVRIDGFSDRPDNELHVPDHLFFSDERTVDLNEVYGTRNKRYKVRGLINIFDSYKFTINENTPIEEEIALDPELLGQVFENLLASYNPETETTARKQTGSFYTPREIVNYMVDESLILYLQNKLPPNTTDKVNERLRHLVAYNDQPHRFSSGEVNTLINAIDNVKILDLACGSGAFPMGILHKLVFILAKLDPRNEKWQQRQIDRVNEAIKAAEQIEDSTFRERTISELEQQIADIHDAFERNELDYGRKLFLIENCIYGVDIQPIACQIAKLRFFISLVVDQKIEDQRPNRGIRPLPNLETKFVAANTLLSVKKPIQLILRNEEIDKKEKELADVRRKHFTASTPRTKAKYRKLDEEIRQEIAALLQKDGFPRETTEKLARWDPYDQNAYADFFDPEWMFGIIAESKKTPSLSTLRGSLSIINEAGGQGELTPVDEFEDGFDIIIGNPPYVRQEEIKEFKPAFKELYDCFTGVADLYVYFYERSIKLLKTGGVLTFISSNKFFRAGYGEKLRAFLGQKTSLQQVIDFGDAPVFTAISYLCIVILTRQPANGNQARVMTWQPGPPIEEFASVFQANGFSMSQKELNSDGWRLESPAVLRLLEKLRKAGKPLGEYVNGRFYYGIKTGLNEAFVVDRATRDRLIAEHKSSAEILKPFLRGRDVKRWRIDFAEQYLIKIESSANKDHPWSDKSEKEAEKIFARTYPAIHARFETYRKALINRDDQGQHFWELRPCIYWREFEQSKIIYPDIYEHQSFAWDEYAYFAGNTCYFIPAQQKWLCSLLNSQAVEWFYSNVSNKVRGGYMRAFSDYMKEVPVPPVADRQKTQLTDLADQILTAKKFDLDADVAALEAEIDQLVYSLYGLTREEIAIIEASLQERTGSREVADDSVPEQET